jgi:lysophospholipase L1-like esterase
VDSIIHKEHPADSIELTGAGIGGNKVYDLYLRMEDDVLKKNPDVVVIYVGINDVWHKASMGTGTDLDKFERFYRAMIKKLQEKNIRVIVCTPSVIGERNDNTNQQDGDLNQYSQVIRSIAKDLSLRFAISGNLLPTMKKATIPLMRKRNFNFRQGSFER